MLRFDVKSVLVDNFLDRLTTEFRRVYGDSENAFCDAIATAGQMAMEILAETDALLAQSPNDPYALELKGQILLESGKPREALDPLAMVRPSGGVVDRDPGPRDRVLVLEQQSGLFEDALLAAGVDVHQHLAGGKDGCETVHLVTSGYDGGMPWHRFRGRMRGGL